MGSFTKKLTKRRTLVRFTLTPGLAPFGWDSGDDRRVFVMAMQSGAPEPTDKEIQRSITKLGRSRVGIRGVRDWWWDIGPRWRASVRYCFRRLHGQPSSLPSASDQ